MKKIITTQINRQKIFSLLEEMIQIIDKYWGRTIRVAHGGVSNVEEENQFQYKAIQTRELIDNLIHEEQNEDFMVGEWDYFITDDKQKETLQLCHESDIHIETSIPGLYLEIVKLLQEKEINFTEIEE